MKKSIVEDFIYSVQSANLLKNQAKVRRENLKQLKCKIQIKFFLKIKSFRISKKIYNLQLLMRMETKWNLEILNSKKYLILSQEKNRAKKAKYF